MRIIFGIGHFLIKSYKPGDLGLPGEETDYTIELRQRYFHIFWIPFIGFQKVWCIRKDGGLYNIPEEYKAIFNSFKKPRMPWYAFSGLILVILISIGWPINEKYASYQSRQRDIEWVNHKNEMINNPQKGDQYVFRAKGRDNIIMEIKELRQDSLLFITPDFDLDEVSSEIVCEYGFVDSLTNRACVWLDKATLMGVSCQDPEKLMWFEGKEVEQLLFMTPAKIVLDRIDRQ